MPRDNPDDDDPDNDDEGWLPIPARPSRVVLGLVLMVLGFFTMMGLLGHNPWCWWLGFVLFIGSFLVMMKQREKKIDS